MADYYAQVFGVFPNGRVWSTARHITSSQSPAALLTTWSNAWIAAWTDAAHGLNAAYPVGTVMKEFTVATLNGQMREIAKTPPLAVTQPGTNTNNSLPVQVSVVASWRSSTAIGRFARGHQALPAPAEDQVLNDKLTDPAWTRFSAAMNAIKTAITADGSTFFLFPKFLTTTGIPPFTKTVTDVVEARDKVGTQDHRYKKEPALYR